MSFSCFDRRRICDPVLGMIPIFADCDEKLLELPLLQRLRRIKQLPVVPFVFPAADHSRFVHSLGAYYWAHHYAEALGLSDEESALVRWGALLHDVGHYPCSHGLEYVYQRIPSAAAPTGVDIAPAQTHAWDAASEDPLWFACWAPRPANPDWAHHEALTRYALETDSDFETCIERAAPGFSTDDVLNVLKRNPPPQQAKLRQVFHSQVDVDRMDYLVRDSYVTGATYGLVEPSHLIKHAQIAESRHDEEDEQSKAQVIAYDKKAVTILDHFVLARYFYYSNVIYHKTVQAFDLLLKAVAAALVKEGASNVPATYEAVRGLCDDGSFVYFTDDVIHAAVGQRARRDDVVGEFCRMLLHRVRPVTVIEMRGTRIGDDGRLGPEMQNLLRELRDRDSARNLAEAAGVDPRRLGWTSWELTFENLHPYLSPIEIHDGTDASEDRLDQIWIAPEGAGQPELLTRTDGSLLNALRDRAIVGACVYYFSEHDGDEEVERLRTEIERRLA